MGAPNNQNNPVAIVVPLGSPSADLTVPAVSTNRRRLVIEKVQIMNGAIIAASDTDYAVINLKNDSTVLASYDSRAAGEGAIAANVAGDFDLDAAVAVDGFSAAALVVEAGQSLSVQYDETDSGTSVALTNAVVVIHGYWL